MSAPWSRRQGGRGKDRSFFLSWKDGLYRAAFLEYLREAFYGKCRAGALEEKIGKDLETLDAEFLEFLAVLEKEAGMIRDERAKKKKKAASSGWK